jgi:hypothetical protein
MKLKLLICAENVIIDRTTHKLSLINIIDDLYSEGFPLLFPNFYICVGLTKLDGEPDSCDITANISLDGEELFRSPLEIDFEGGRSARALAQLQSLVISKPGVLEIRVEHAGKEIGCWPLIVESRQPTLRD